MFDDEDEDLPHEVSEETVVTKNRPSWGGCIRTWFLRAPWSWTHLDFPVILYEVWAWGGGGINTPCCSKTPPGSRCGRLWGTEAAATAVNKLHWPGIFSCEPGSPTVPVGCWFVSGLEMTGWEGNGTPLQYSCLENPMDGGAWWAAVHGVAKSRTRLSGFIFTFMHWRRKWQPTPVFLPGESQGRGSLVGCRLWGRTESDTTIVT